MHLVDRQTWPKQSSIDFQLKNVVHNFHTDPNYKNLPTLEDRLYAAITDLLLHLSQEVYRDSNGNEYTIDQFGIDDSDGDHRLTVHNVCRDNPKIKAIPMKGWAPSASSPELPTPKRGSGDKHGFQWIEHKRKENARGGKWLQGNVSEYKKLVHEGFKASLGTSESISLFDVDNPISHQMVANHCNSEIPSWRTVAKVDKQITGFLAWTRKPGVDNHCFDNLVGCLILANYVGSQYKRAVSKPKPVMPKIETADAWSQFPELYT